MYICKSLIIIFSIFRMRFQLLQILRVSVLELIHMKNVHIHLVGHICQHENAAVL